jgi:hypothetical protein
MITTLTIELPVAGLPSVAELPANFADEARFLLAVKIFEQGRISSSKASHLCDMGRVEIPAGSLSFRRASGRFARR